MPCTGGGGLPLTGEAVAQFLMAIATLGLATVLFGMGIAVVRRKNMTIDD